MSLLNIDYIQQGHSTVHYNSQFYFSNNNHHRISQTIISYTTTLNYSSTTNYNYRYLLLIPQGYIENIVSNLIKFSCYIMLRSLTYDRTGLEVMNPWPTNENDAAFYYCVVKKTNFFTIKISQGHSTLNKDNLHSARTF
jgi:hypothetical protein